MSCGCGCGAPARPNGSYASDACRARAWKARRHYGPQKPLGARSNGNAARSKPSGAQVSYRKAVGAAAEMLVQAGHAPYKAERIAERYMVGVLPEKQRARMHATHE